jgi:hypothetical protein
MTAREFNQKWAQFLEPGHYGLAIDSPSVCEYLDKVFEGLTKIPGFEYYQIKTKFEYSSFYSNLVEILSPEVGLMIQRSIQQELDFLNRVEDEVRKRQFKQ